MKKAIILLMAMLVMAGSASAVFDVYYTDAVSPYKVDNIAGTNLLYFNGSLMLDGSAADFHVMLIERSGNYLIVNLTATDTCLTPPYSRPRIYSSWKIGSDGKVTAFGDVSGLSEESELMLTGDPSTTSSGYIGRSTTNKTLCTGAVIVSPMVQGMSNKVKLLLPEEVILEYSSNCPVDDTIEPTGRLPCVQISSASDTAVKLTVGGSTVSVPRSGVIIYPHAAAPEPICTDTDGLDTSTKGYVSGVHEYFTGGYPETARETLENAGDMCSAALRGGAVPTEGMPYIVNEWYCEDNMAKSRGIECAAGEMCDGGRCVPLPASDRSGSCASVECAEGEVCRAGVCVSTGAASTEGRKERVKTQINSMKKTLAKTEASKCGTPLKTTADITGEMDVTKLTAALKEMSAIQAKIARCAGISFTAAPVVRTNRQADATKLLAAFHSNAKTMMKSKGVTDVRAVTKTAATTAPAANAPAPKASFFSRLFSK